MKPHLHMEVGRKMGVLVRDHVIPRNIQLQERIGCASGMKAPLVSMVVNPMALSKPVVTKVF